MGVHRLILHPDDPHEVPGNVVALGDALGAIGFIGAAFSLASQTHYFTGEHFLDHITFLGCSPVIALDPPREAVSGGLKALAESFCHIGLRIPTAEPVFMTGRNTVAPRCPRCGHRAGDWRPMVAAWRAHPTGCRWQCPACGHEAPPPALGWRQSAGWFRFAIEVWGIHPAEAVPGEQLMDILARYTRGGWRFFYHQG